MSGGRAICGLGGAWNQEEADAFGIEFGASPGERLRWLEEAAVIVRGMLHGEEPSGSQYYDADHVMNLPAPIQGHLPLLIGGGGERKTLRIVALHADACNLGGGFERVAHKEQVLLAHCAEVGRDPAEIERTAGMGVTVIRSTHEAAQARLDELASLNGGARAWPNQLIGTPEEVAANMQRYLDIGYRHLICGFPAPFDVETMERMQTEVRPMLEASA
jgi:alkanesulfonate monooxygenase SsuD/methylene tetrahydromethanopterin reductase-like flavin-dependent oxidoreductase (luciferase family)